MLRCHHLIQKAAAFHYLHSQLKIDFQAFMRCILYIVFPRIFIYSPKINSEKYRLLNRGI